MKPLFTSFIIGLLLLTVFFSCSKENFFRSEKEVKKDLQGTWNLIPIPRYDKVSATDSIIHIETWTFNDSKVTIVNNGVIATSTYSVKTSVSKAEFKLDGITPAFVAPARIREINGTWRIIRIDGDILIIANDQDGKSGLTELEFEK